MLVLERKPDQSIVIHSDIVVTILGVDGDRVKLGIEAPREVPVLRGELCEAVRSQNRAAAESSSDVRRFVPVLRHELLDRKASLPQG